MQDGRTRSELTTIAKGYVDKLRGTPQERQSVLNQLAGRIGPNEKADLLSTEYAAATALAMAFLDTQERSELMGDLLKAAREL